MRNLTATEFNDKYPVGYGFIYQPFAALRGGLAVNTTSEAVSDGTDTVVQINNPTKSWVSVQSLTPSGSTTKQ